jgi:hypothetical protein
MLKSMYICLADGSVPLLEHTCVFGSNPLALAHHVTTRPGSAVLHMAAI